MAVAAGQTIIELLIFAGLSAMQQMRGVAIYRISIQYVLSYYNRIISIKAAYMV